MNRTVKEHLVFYKLFTICACLAPACLKDKTKFCYPRNFWRRQDWEKYVRFTSSTKWTKTIGWKIKSFRRKQWNVLPNLKYILVLKSIKKFKVVAHFGPNHACWANPTLSYNSDSVVYASIYLYVSTWSGSFSNSLYILTFHWTELQSIWFGNYTQQNEILFNSSSAV